MDNINNVNNIFEKESLDALGIYGKLVRKNDGKNGSERPSDGGFEARKNLYKLHSKIQRLLYRYTERNEFKGIKRCHRLVHGGSHVAIKMSQHGTPYYWGVDTCRNKWVCPICLGRYEKKRANDLSQIMYHVYHNMQDMKVILLTLTVPHYYGQLLDEVMSKFQRALQLLQRNNSYKKRLNDWGYFDYFKCSEITYGSNGWHFHQHIALIVRADVDVHVVQKYIRGAWYTACSSADIEIHSKRDFNKYAVDVMDNCHASDYLVKSGIGYWGIDKEITSAGKKSGNITPFQLAESNEPHHHHLFVEYARATRRKQKLQIGRKLHNVLRLLSDDEVDEEIEKEQEQDIFEAVLCKSLYNFIYRMNIRGEVLNKIIEGGFSALYDYLLPYYGQIDLEGKNLTFDELLMSGDFWTSQ